MRGPAARLGAPAPPFVLGFDFACTLIDDAPDLAAGTLVMPQPGP
ncbi:MULTISPECIES: hypothetical protein [Streptomyces]|nr:hypothetical protein [Streptomyces venezuelae]